MVIIISLHQVTKIEGILGSLHSSQKDGIDTESRSLKYNVAPGANVVPLGCHCHIYMQNRGMSKYIISLSRVHRIIT